MNQYYINFEDGKRLMVNARSRDDAIDEALALSGREFIEVVSVFNVDCFPAENLEIIKRLQEINTELLAERISYGELAEIDDLAEKYRVKVTDEMLSSDVIEAITEKVSA